MITSEDSRPSQSGAALIYSRPASLLDAIRVRSQPPTKMERAEIRGISPHPRPLSRRRGEEIWRKMGARA
jgi:hypothetical protein